MPSQKQKAGKKGGGKPAPEVIRFGAAAVKIHRKADGRLDLIWREEGRERRTTRADAGEARSFAERKVRELEGKSGRQWIAPGEAEALAALRDLAAAEGIGVGEFVGEIAAAVRALGKGGIRKLREAGAHYSESGAGSIVDRTLREALAIVRAEYDDARGATRSTMRTALDGMRRTMPERRLLEVTRLDVEAFVLEGGRAIRTIRNRHGQASTFFARCRALGFWPPSKPIPTVAVRRPRLPDKAPEIFTPAQGKRLLARVAKDCPRYLRYLVAAGWCGCRPSECVRIRWEDLDLEHGILHLSAEAVGKTARERWVPLEPEVIAFFAEEKERLAPGGGDRLCITRSREELSKLARGMGIPWPADVLRHSAITFALQIAGNDYNKTAERMGNSPRVIESNYRRPIPAGYGRQWFALLEGIAGRRGVTGSGA
jgi:integrase